MAKPRRWYDSNEKTAAKKMAKALDEQVLEYRKRTRTGTLQKFYYVGYDLPKAYTKGDYTTKVVYPT